MIANGYYPTTIGAFLVSLPELLFNVLRGKQRRFEMAVSVGAEERALTHREWSCCLSVSCFNSSGRLPLSSGHCPTVLLKRKAYFCLPRFLDAGFLWAYA
jgi:hypothetical protein